MLPIRSICMLVLALTSCSALGLELLAEEDPPHNMSKSGKVVGIATEKLTEAFQRAGINSQISMVPWARAYLSALKHPDHCAFSAARTADREKLFKWIGPIAAMDWVLYSRADTTPPSRLADVRDEAIGGYVQDVISVWLADHGYRVENASNDALNPRKLLAGRINYWASSRPRATSMLAREGLASRIVPVLTFGHTDLYLACHQSTPDSMVQKLNGALRKMKEDGTSARIEARYARWPED